MIRRTTALVNRHVEVPRFPLATGIYASYRHTETPSKLNSHAANSILNVELRLNQRWENEDEALNELHFRFGIGRGAGRDMGL